MSNYLVQHALANVWCSPEQDRQSAFRPARLTKSMGTYRSIKINFEDIHLPNITDRFYVYQIGQIDPDLINLIEVRNTWIPISRLCRDYNLLVDIYTVDGIQYPRFETWILITRNKNVIIAVKEQLTINLLSTKDIYIRFYTNAYFSSIRKDSNAYNYIYVYGNHIRSSADRDNIITRVVDKLNVNGKTYGFINGRYTTTFNSSTINIGDVVEIVHDTTIKNVVDFKVDTLDSFVSTLDTKNKYLLAPNYNGSNIDFYDDIDVYIYKTVNNVETGVFYHKNAVDAMRMVTHKAWALPVQYVEAYQTNNSFLSNYSDLNIRLYIRHSGYERNLIDEANNIKYLYTLPTHTDITNALLGVNANIPEWRASTLEASDYCKTMRSRSWEVSPLLAENSYGYKTVSTLVGKVTNKTDNGSFPIPYTARDMSKSVKVWGYDNNGKLLAATQSGPIPYTTVDEESTLPLYSLATAKFVEVIPVENSATKYTCWPTPIGSPVVYNGDYNIRCYKCLITQDGPTFDWDDVTGSNDYTKILGDNNTFTIEWNVSTSVFLCLVITDAKLLNNAITLDTVEGYLQFSVNPTSYFNGNPFTVKFPPLGSLEVWSNGNALVEGIDYIVNYPQVTIISKRHINGNIGDTNIIQYRGLGFCDEDCVYRNKADVGWIKYGQLSRNSEYDLLANRNLKFVANGKTYLQEDVVVAESNLAPTVFDSLNGTPYCIMDLDPPLFSYVTQDIYNYRKSANESFKRVSNYMTLKKPQNADPAQTSAGLDKYELYSPFIGAIINGILNNDIDSNMYTTMPSNSSIEAALTGYLPLLAVDPSQVTNGSLLDKEFIVIHPHMSTNVINLTFGQWRFLKRVVEIYTKSKVDISHFIAISQ